MEWIPSSAVIFYVALGIICLVIFRELMCARFRLPPRIAGYEVTNTEARTRYLTITEPGPLPDGWVVRLLTYILVELEAGGDE